MNKYGIVIFLPDFLQDIVRPLREQFDPEWSLISAHITLVAPFTTSRSLDEISVVIARETAGLSSTTVSLGSVA
ncbi:MAG: hypothetical protein V3T31_09045, partial [candidate division Zixibacteria bacterium]